MARELRVEKYTGVIEAVMERAKALDVFVIARIQDSQSRNVVINNGKVERVGTAQGLGIGIQAFTHDGHNGFASSDDVTPEAAVSLVEVAARLAKSASDYGTEANTTALEIGKSGAETISTGAQALSESEFDPQIKRALDINAEAQQIANDPAIIQDLATYTDKGEVTPASLSIMTGFSAADVQWRIARSDGTDYRYDTPLSAIRNFITATPTPGMEGQVVSAYAGVHGLDATLFFDEKEHALLVERTKQVAAQAHALVTAPMVESGHYKLVLDYPLAGTLAHEAFGHCSETDGMETSILGENGKVRVGASVASEIVSIIDGPVMDEYGYIPVSANGQPRQTVEIVKDGVLMAALSDLFSAERAGVPISGAERIESYRNVPVPRMSNTRIVVKEPIALPDGATLENTHIETVRDLLKANGLMGSGETVLLLGGFRGGQVMPKEGDFVFQGTLIYKITDDKITLCQPSIFSGQVLSALHSIIGGIGEPVLDVMGQCGKAGQGVPVGTGANVFIVIDRNDNVTIGGS